MEAEAGSRNRKEKERTELFVQHIPLSLSSSWNMKGEEGRLEAEAGTVQICWLCYLVGAQERFEFKAQVFAIW